MIWNRKANLVATLYELDDIDFHEKDEKVSSVEERDEEENCAMKLPYWQVLWFTWEFKTLLWLYLFMNELIVTFLCKKTFQHMLPKAIRLNNNWVLMFLFDNEMTYRLIEIFSFLISGNLIFLLQHISGDCFFVVLCDERQPGTLSLSSRNSICIQ